MSEQAPDGQHTDAAEDAGYVTFVARLWIDEGGKRVRGTLQDVHSGARLPIDLSGLIAFVRDSIRRREGPSIDEPDA